MNKYLRIFLFLFIFSSILSSCSEDEGNNEPPLTINGEWKVESRTITTGDASVDERINRMFYLDGRDYIIKRIFKENAETPGAGVEEQVALDRNTGNTIRQSDGTYTTVKDSVFTVSSKIPDMREVYKLTQSVLVTNGKVNRRDIAVLISEIGGDPNALPLNISGELKTRATR